MEEGRPNTKRGDGHQHYQHHQAKRGGYRGHYKIDQLCDKDLDILQIKEALPRLLMKAQDKVNAFLLSKQYGYKVPFR